ncbi:MAG: hypothetical protein Unbinned6284contig1004_34 [Prokaryotic dsDNA virus sp.]|nr:MAG: hypothetical protein Unbinned6284contig1004_34 [Prokaryotic dsDNA virus sp.]|tara:strand:- start:3236 stop:3580 length:345 start_codon:yes stop_codon:yes gene_type:complete
MKHNQKTIAAAILLDNYYKGNLWLSTKDAMNGYEMVLDGKETMVFSDISRRLSDIKVAGFKLEKYNKFNNTNYTAYRLSPTMTHSDLERLAMYCGFVKDKTLFNKLFDKLFSND